MGQDFVKKRATLKTIRGREISPGKNNHFGIMKKELFVSVGGGGNPGNQIVA